MFFVFDRKQEKRQLDIVTKIFERSRGFLSADRYESCIEMIEHNEAGIALEILCSNIEDSGIVIPIDLYLDIKALLASWSSTHNIDYYDIKTSIEKPTDK